jgi:hypothetical protein
MYAKRCHFDWLRENIEQRLSRIDCVIAALLPTSIDVPDLTGDEPWLEELFERRQSVQSTLFELEQQSGGQLPETRVAVERLACGDAR